MGVNGSEYTELTVSCPYKRVRVIVKLETHQPIIPSPSFKDVDRELCFGPANDGAWLFESPALGNAYTTQTQPRREATGLWMCLYAHRE